MVKQIDRDVVALGDPGDPEFEASIFSSVRSSNSHPDLLLIHHNHPHFFRSHWPSTLDFHFLSHYSNIKAIMLKKAITGLNVLASWMPHGFDWASLMMTWGHLGQYLGTN